MSGYDPLELQTPTPPRTRRRPLGFWVGLVLVLAGLFLLLDNLGLLRWLNWRVALPIVLILAGLALVVRRFR